MRLHLLEVLSGGEMIYSEDLQSNITRGWKISNLGDFCEFAYGEKLPKDLRRDGSVPVYGSNRQFGWHEWALVKGPGIVVGRKRVAAGTVKWVQSD
jgi:type I restriction enzyme, S subunit